MFSLARTAMISAAFVKTTQSKRVTALVVDDDADFNAALTFTLESLGVNTTSAVSGNDAIRELTKRRFDLLFLDFRLPDIDGARVLERIRDQEEHTVVAIMTAHPEGALVQRARDLHPEDFLPKPFSRADVEQVLQKANGARTSNDNRTLTMGEGEQIRR